MWPWKKYRLLDVFDYCTDADVIHELDGLGRNALMYAVHFGHLDTIQILLEQGIDINYAAHGKFTFHVKRKYTLSKTRKQTNFGFIKVDTFECSLAWIIHFNYVVSNTMRI